MKSVVFVLLLFVGLAAASVDVYNYSVPSQAAYSSEISGFVNLVIENEPYDSSIDFNGGSVELGEFLEDNGANFSCLPIDCSEGYSQSSGASEQVLSLELLEEGYVGFVIEGGDIVVDTIDFQISSDFEREIRRPLEIEFFEGESWGYDKFSEEFLLKDWGCFDSLNKKLGPLVGNSFYCEAVSIGDSGVLKVGADVYGGSGDLNMVLYPDTGFGASWECSFDPTVEDGCVISPDVGEIFEEGDYWVCVGADSLTEYRVYEDESGESCGFAKDAGSESSVKDYGIFVQGVKYEDADEMGIVDFGGYVDEANTIINERYDGSCQDGCILPLKVVGVKQNFKIYNVNIVYTDDSEWESTDLVYDLEMEAAKVDFNGTLDLGFLGIVVDEEGEYYAEISGEDLFRKNIDLIPAPIVTSLSPRRSPAGVPVVFLAGIDFDGNSSLTYVWDFGDGTKETTSDPFATHSYNDLKNYTLSLRVSAGGNLSSEKSFDIEAINPEEAVDSGLLSRRIALGKVRGYLEAFPDWYRGEIEKVIEVDSFYSELDRLDRERNNSFSEEDFRDVAVDLYSLNIPVLVGANSFESPFLMTELNDINTEPVSVISGPGQGSNEDYKNPILTWQNENVEVFIKSREVFVTYWDRTDKEVLSAYSFDVKSISDRESYFVIGKSFSELYFKENVGARKAGDSTVIILDPFEEVSFEFYYSGNDRGEFFVSPKLSSLIIEANIDEDCNFNGVCEDGEDYNTCRTDCKPVAKAWVLFVFGLLFLLVIYSVLQIWYKKHYEAYLFRDGNSLFNLLMYVTNARARGVKDSRIAAELRAKGWNSERVNYIIRKSRGSSVGMIEIIPIERISALIRNWKAKKRYENKMKVDVGITGSGQQFNNNINKSGM